jgi:hypothetical protein
MVGAKGCFADLRASLAGYGHFTPTTRASNPPGHHVLWASMALLRRGYHAPGGGRTLGRGPEQSLRSMQNHPSVGADE